MVRYPTPSHDEHKGGSVSSPSTETDQESSSSLRRVPTIMEAAPATGPFCMNEELCDDHLQQPEWLLRHTGSRPAVAVD